MSDIQKQPWMKFYPADWRSEPALRVCSVGARGLWMEMLCIMHDAEPRGSMVIGGQPVTMAQLAGLVGNISVKQAQTLFTELETARVFSRDDDGVIYSRRIRRDIAKAAKDKAFGKTGGNPNLKPKHNGGVNPRVIEGDKAQSLEARVQKPETKSVSDFEAREKILEQFFEAYPKRGEEDGTAREIDRLLSDGVYLIDIIAGAKRYAVDCKGRAENFVSSPVKWLRDGRWKDGKPRPERTLPIIQQDSPQGRAWDEFRIATEGKPCFWLDRRTTVPTEWPPGWPPAAQASGSAPP